MKFSFIKWSLNTALGLFCLTLLNISTYGQIASGAIPLFQFGIFYNVDLEIDPGGNMLIKAPVFSNGGIWCGSSSVNYASTVWAVGNVDTSNNDPFDTNKSGNGGTPSANFAVPPVSNVAPIQFPVFGTNNLHAMLNLPPADYAMGTAAAYSRTGMAYMANQVDLVISNAAYGTNWGGGVLSIPGTNFFVYYQNSLEMSALQKVTNDFYIVNVYTNTKGPYGKMYSTNYVAPGVLGTNASTHLATNIVYAGYTFLTNVLFYDAREGWNNGSGNGKPVQAVQFDIARFNAWLNNTNLNGSTNYNGGRSYNLNLINDKNHPIDSIYIYNGVSPGQPYATVLPAVRVVNGQQLYDSHGLGIATPFPLYVKGDFNVQTPSGSSAGQNNTTYTYPAGLYADAITVLSSNWDDSPHSVTYSPVANSSITINAGCFQGIVESDASANINGSGGYSGGMESSFRLLENWVSKTMWFNGSIVIAFPSQYATNHWNGGYYGVPIRLWAYDHEFSKLDQDAANDAYGY